jgi:hypothetical protein
MHDRQSPSGGHPGDPHELVTVYTVQEPTLAELLRQELAAEGIRCQVSGENQAGLSGLLRIDLLVQAMDSERARQILSAFEARQQHTEG